MPDKSKEKTLGYIHIIRGLISFHERMKLCSLAFPVHGKDWKQSWNRRGIRYESGRTVSCHR